MRAIWRAIVVLPVPWAPPIRKSSPGRMPSADRLVERREAQRDGLVVGQVAGRDPVVQVHQDVEGGPGHQAPGVGVQAPLRLRPARGGLLDLGAHACTRSPGVADGGADPRAGHRSTRLRQGHPTGVPSAPGRLPGQAPSAASSSKNRTSARIPVSKLARSIHSFGAWALPFGGMNPSRTYRQAQDRTRSWPRPGSSHPRGRRAGPARTSPRGPARSRPRGRVVVGVRVGRPPPQRSRRRPGRPAGRSPGRGPAGARRSGRDPGRPRAGR